MERAFVSVKLAGFDPEENEDLARQISELSGVDAVYEISGLEWDLLVQVTVDNATDIDQIVIRQIKPIFGVETTKTVLVLETFTKGG